MVVFVFGRKQERRNEKKKEEILAKQQITYKCDICDLELKVRNKAYHNLSKKHLHNLELLKNEIKSKKY